MDFKKITIQCDREVSFSPYTNAALEFLAGDIDQSFRSRSSKRLQDFIVEAVRVHEIDLTGFSLIYNAFMSPHVNFDFFHINLINHHDEADERFVVLHELAHVKQFLDKVMAIRDGKCKWGGQRVKLHLNEVGYDVEAYNKLPQELHANLFALESPLYMPVAEDSIYRICVDTAMRYKDDRPVYKQSKRHSLSSLLFRR